MKNTRTHSKALQLLLVFGLVLSLTACDLLPKTIDIPWLNPQTHETVVPLPGVKQTPTVPDLQTQPPEDTTPPEPPKSLKLWVSPELAPGPETAAGRLLQDRLLVFEEQSGVAVHIRVKSQTGAGGLLDSLEAASAVAPQALPDLIVLSHQDLAAAAEKKLLYPHAEMADLMKTEDWYPFANELADQGAEILGIPFMGDALVALYDPQSEVVPAADWSEVVSGQGVLGFAADDPLAVFPLLLYLSLDGEVEDPQHHILLEKKPLTEMLTILRTANQERKISDLSLGFQSHAQAWKAFLSRSLDAVVVPANRLIGPSPDPGLEQIKPSLMAPRMTLINAWAFALSSPDPAAQRIAASLADFLTESQFLAQWTQALGMLPSRPSALSLWEDNTYQASLDVIASTALLNPRAEVYNRVGPVLRNAVILILKDNASPEETAKEALESMQ